MFHVHERNMKYLEAATLGVNAAVAAAATHKDLPEAAVLLVIGPALLVGAEADLGVAQAGCSLVNVLLHDIQVMYELKKYKDC